MEPGNAGKKYDLEERTLEFAKRVRRFFKCIPKSVANWEDGRQLIRSSGSIGSNYIEANDSLGRKDFLLHIRISRKETKESIYWLRLIDLDNSPDLEAERAELIQEAGELRLIFGAIERNSSQ